MKATSRNIQIRIAELRTDRGTQTRASISAATVTEYAACMRREAKFPPIKVYRVNGEFWVVDGFHRLEAAKQCGFDTIEAEVFDGTRSDAIRASLQANQTHGLRRSNADKRSAAKLGLNEFPNSSARDIADWCGVSHELVASIKRKQPESNYGSEGKTRGRDGKWRKMRRPAAARATGEHAQGTSEASGAGATPEKRDSEPSEATSGHTQADAGQNKPASGTSDSAKRLERILKLMYEEVRNCTLEQLVELHPPVLSALNHLFTWPDTVSDPAALVKIAQQAEKDYEPTITKRSTANTPYNSPNQSIRPNPGDNE
jgi:hypothetical protein